MMDSLTGKYTAREMLNKVPEVTLLFWLTKVLTTGMGEVFSDFLFFTTGLPHVTVLCMGLTGLGVTLALQFAARRYKPVFYWLAVVAVSIFGTMFADVIHGALGLSFTSSTLLFVAFQAIVFICWYASEKTLSVHSIYTRRREAFYWTTVLGTFALGTAAGDFTAFGLHLGTFASGLLFAALIAIPAVGYKFWGWNEIFSFWFAYVMTRPLGASFSDWMAQDLGWGTGKVSFALSVVIVLLVWRLASADRKATLCAANACR